MLGRKSTKENITKLMHENHVISDPPEMAMYLNEYFCSVAKDIHAKLPFIKYVNSSPNLPNSLLIHPTEENEIFNIINSFTMKYSKGGNDEFSVRHIKWVAKEVAKPLSALINGSLEKGVFPDFLKISRVTPIYKGGRKDDMNNYRPISIQSVFSKKYMKKLFTIGSRILLTLLDY
jgi:hypothetical protein